MRILEPHLDSIHKEIPKFWLEQEEVKEMLKAKQELREKRTVSILAKKEKDPSVSRKICGEWHLDREQIRHIMRSLEKDRRLQATFTNLIGATRFKAIEKDKLYITRCPKCKKELDAWERHKKCYEIEAPQKEKGGSRQKWGHLIRDFVCKVETRTPAKFTATSVTYEKFFQEIEKSNKRDRVLQDNEKE